MSANNYIKIHKEDMEWMVSERDAESGEEMTDLGGWADLESAIQCANSFMSTNEVEYGLDIDI